MGFEVWFNGVHYDYSKLKKVSIIVDKDDLSQGNMVEHTRIDITTRDFPNVCSQCGGPTNPIPIRHSKMVKVKGARRRDTGNPIKAHYRRYPKIKSEIQRGKTV